MINYEQLGLKFKLYSCEVLFNRGLCYIYDGRQEEGMKDLEFAAKEKLEPEHDVIDDAIKDNADVRGTRLSTDRGLLTTISNIPFSRSRSEFYIAPTNPRSAM